ncbi:hypothetical protein [Pseudoalteromonas aurantia]|uniref:Uncharacterized protein n=1 Tax=Pseudoalteromonas aurantia TaxID=43654 RepID=A0ABY2W2Y8_9GAMM|nr:hypothetical protein [Pseudoalteromonas aurantia]TMO67687.1 hypothetical protein CWC18_00335 [Pseudoalteromonas aurantia]TMO78938.1 hypothetical protein CWC20_00585 [Pseudoalteromonas aurantia]
MQYIVRIDKARTLILKAMAQRATQQEVLRLDPLAELNLPYTNWLPRERVIQLFYRSLAKKNVG